MGVSQNVLKSSEDWDEKLLEETILNVVSFLTRMNFKNLELRLLVPYRTSNLRLLDNKGLIDQEFLKNLTKDSNFYQEYIDKEAGKIVPLMAQIIRKTIELRKEEFSVVPVFNLYATEKRNVYLNDWVKSVTNMFISMNDEIEDKEKKKTHVIYIIDSSLFKDIPYEKNVPFQNYVVY
jgi:hypothetical protein